MISFVPRDECVFDLRAVVALGYLLGNLETRAEGGQDRR